MMRIVARTYLGLLLVFLLGPALLVAVDSVNSATSFPSGFEHATLHWYGALADHPEFLEAFGVSLEIALAASALATAAGLLAAYGLRRIGARPRGVATLILSGPLLVPEIVVGLAVLQLGALAGVQLGTATLVGTHAVFLLPLTLRFAAAALAGLDARIEEAARDLGAGRLQTLVHVTLPLLRPSLSAAFVLSAVLSFVNLPLSMFLTSARTATLPVVTFAYMESRIDPMAAAVATLVMLAAALTALLVDRVLTSRLLG